MTETDVADLVALRRALRLARRAVTPDAQQTAAARVAARIVALPAYAAACTIAVYLARDGELDPAPLAARARTDGKALLLPVLAPGAGAMTFAEWPEDAALLPNRYGIPEPVGTAHRPAAALDLVLTPLVGFDVCGGRLGMGGGYYDRTFAFLLGAPRPARPCLLGLAHACQRVARLDARPWDVPLDAVVTDDGVYAPA